MRPVKRPCATYPLLGKANLKVEHGYPHVNELHVPDGAQWQCAMLKEVDAPVRADQAPRLEILR